MAPAPARPQAEVGRGGRRTCRLADAHDGRVLLTKVAGWRCQRTRSSVWTATIFTRACCPACVYEAAAPRTAHAGRCETGGMAPEDRSTRWACATAVACAAAVATRVTPRSRRRRHAGRGDTHAARGSRALGAGTRGKEVRDDKHAVRRKVDCPEPTRLGPRAHGVRAGRRAGERGALSGLISCV